MEDNHSKESSFSRGQANSSRACCLACKNHLCQPRHNQESNGKLQIIALTCADMVRINSHPFILRRKLGSLKLENERTARKCCPDKSGVRGSLKDQYMSMRPDPAAEQFKYQDNTLQSCETCCHRRSRIPREAMLRSIRIRTQCEWPRRYSNFCRLKL